MDPKPDERAARVAAEIEELRAEIEAMETDGAPPASSAPRSEERPVHQATAVSP